MSPEDLEKLHNRIDDLEKLILLAVPRARLPRKLHNDAVEAKLPPGLNSERASELLRIFEITYKLPLTKKFDQKFPEAIVVEKMEAVPKSLLVNRAAMRKIFAPIFSSGERSSVENVIRALEMLCERDLLYQISLIDTNLETVSQVMTVFSPRWAKIVKPDVQPAPVRDKIIETISRDVAAESYAFFAEQAKKNLAADAAKAFVPKIEITPEVAAQRAQRLKELNGELECSNCGSPSTTAICEDCEAFLAGEAEANEKATKEFERKIEL